MKNQISQKENAAPLMVCLVLAFLLALFSGNACGQNQAGEGAGGVKKDAKEGLRAQPWVFGQSMDRMADLWHKGVNGSTISKNSRPGRAEKAVPKTGGIENALSQGGKNKRKGSVGVDMADHASHWKVAPDEKSFRPDEDMARDRRHVLRAYAGVQAGDDFNISVGPELILKDERHGTEKASADQPDSSLGLGMKFKLDF